MSERMNVIYIEPDKYPTIKEIDGSLESMQDLVGGWIEQFMLDDDVAIICNEEGKIAGLPLNRGIRNEDGELVEIIAGNFFLAYAPIESEEFLPLPKELEEKYMEKFKMPEAFVRTPGGIQAIPYIPEESGSRHLKIAPKGRT